MRGKMTDFGWQTEDATRGWTIVRLQKVIHWKQPDAVLLQLGSQNVSVTWELAENANAQALPPHTESEDGAQELSLASPPGYPQPQE